MNKTTKHFELFNTPSKLIQGAFIVKRIASSTHTSTTKSCLSIVQTTDCKSYMPGDTFYILNFPIDQLSEHVLVSWKGLPIVSLTKITLCVDILNSALFGALCNSRTCEKHPSPISQEGLVHIGEVLNRSYTLADGIPQVKFFTIPLDIFQYVPFQPQRVTSPLILEDHRYAPYPKPFFFVIWPLGTDSLSQCFFSSDIFTNEDTKIISSFDWQSI